MSLCVMCAKVVAPSRCPRCLAPLCALECYKSHGTACTESFYREQITNQLNSHRANPEEQQKMNQILIQSREDQESGADITAKIMHGDQTEHHRPDGPHPPQRLAHRLGQMVIHRQPVLPHPTFHPPLHYPALLLWRDAVVLRALPDALHLPDFLRAHRGYRRALRSPEHSHPGHGADPCFRHDGRVRPVRFDARALHVHQVSFPIIE